MNDQTADVGFHNSDLEASRSRLERGRSYKDLSTIIVVPTRGYVHARVMQSWMNLMMPMNQKSYKMFLWGMEVGKAYNHAIETIIANPELSGWKYILTLEEDNIPPPDALVKLLESIEDYDAVGGLYWTKGEGGQPMIYGNAAETPLNFIPQMPMLDQVQPCNGLGMGFTLFKMDIFKRIEKPWFQTLQTYKPEEGGLRMYTQDLYFFEKLKGIGGRVACDTRVKVGHYEAQRDIVW